LRLFRALSLFLMVAMLAILPEKGRAQAGGKANDPVLTPLKRPVPLKQSFRPYRQPTQKQRFHRYVRWMFSPYSVASMTFVSGLHQAERNPPDWQEGWAGFGERYASNLGTDMVNATARYGLAGALQEDTEYYRCECSGFWPRLRHAVFATFIARRGADGHAAFGVPELVAPYVGPIVSVYTWYPHRYDMEDAFRMGNNGVLSEAGTNVAIEFLPSILHRRGRRWMKRLHLSIPSGAAGAP
jgi:hypothetical protein